MSWGYAINAFKVEVIACEESRSRDSRLFSAATALRDCSAPRDARNCEAMSNVKNVIPESTSAAVHASMVIAVSFRLIGFGPSQRLTFHSKRASTPLGSCTTATGAVATGRGSASATATANATFRDPSPPAAVSDCGSGIFRV